ncbi:MAG: hypothetical protein IID45_12920 [Planctomycetes bacterium]|nr:hypothetical protein [Planctomycetota bacterium]
MPIPTLDGTGFRLKKKPNARSTFWIVGSDINPRDAVKVVGQESGGSWTGNILTSIGDRNLALVTFDEDSSKQEASSTKQADSSAKFSEGDLEIVSITVTNDAGESAPLFDEVVIDGP